MDTTSAGVTDNVALVFGLFLFTVAGIGMILGALTLGRFLRPHLPHPEKDEPYECGEPVVGTSWVQFDLRFYVVALVFLIFEIEIALFFPWAVVYREAGVAGLWDMLFFFGVIVVGFLYLWRFGYLDWVRATGVTDKPTDPVRSDDAVGQAARRWA
ncbi:MAG: NADH-quinone oxidoreductase subunit A [Phycisphaerae bacterium]